MGVDEIVATHKKTLARARNRALIGIAMVVIVFVVAVMLGGTPVMPVALVSFLIASLGILASERSAVRRAWESLTAIASQDCDPEKMLKVLAGLGFADDSGADGRKQSMGSMSIWYATCLALSGQPGAASSVAKEIEAVNKGRRAKDVLGVANLLDLELRIAMAKKDKASAAAVLEKAGGLHGQGGMGFVGDAVDLLEMKAKLGLAVLNSDWAAAKSEAEELLPRVGNKFQYVHLRYARGLACMKQGETQLARGDLSYVIQEGGTLAVCEDARNCFRNR